MASFYVMPFIFNFTKMYTLFKIPPVLISKHWNL